MTQKLEVTTEGLPGVDDAARFEAWNGFTNWGMSFERSEAPLRLRVEARAFGGVEVVRADGTLSQSVRNRRHIAADSDDRFAIGFPLGPVRALARHGHRELEHGQRGEACLVSFAEPMHLTILTPVSRWMRLLLPARPLLSRSPGVEDLVARPLGASGSVLQLLFSYAAFALDNDALSDGETEDLAATHCLDLAALAFGADKDEAELARNRGMRAARLSEVLRQIRRRFADPAFSATGVAQALGLSERYIHRLLQESGESFSERVLALRLDAAMTALSRDPSQRIGEAAYACGFNDLSYFNRCFRRRFGVTPTAARGA